MSKLRGIKVELDAGIVEGPRGLSIGKILFKEKLENGNNVYDVFLENGEIIGQLISDKGDRGDKGDKGDTGRGIISVTKARKVDLMTYYEILYSDYTTEEFAVEDGQNSYELWLGLGNEGTLEEFLEHFRGYSIKNITFREILPDGNYVHDVFLENGEKIGEVISPKGEDGGVNFATFDIIDGYLWVTYSKDNEHINFSINNNGELEVEING